MKNRIILVLPYSSLVTEGFTPNLFGDGYHVRLAKEIWKRSQKYRIECWRPEWKANESMVGEKDGILYRVFPSWRPSLGKFTQFVYKRIVDVYAPLRWSLWKEYSFPLLRALKGECKKGHTIVFVVHAHFDMSYIIFRCCGDVPLVSYNIGGTPFGYSLPRFVSEIPFSLFERKALSHVDAMLLATEWHYESFKSFYEGIPRIVYPFPMGVDFDVFKPIDKFQSRALVGIEPHKKVIIHVGRFDKAKGFDTILDVLPELRQNYPVELIAIGGTRDDMLYDRAKGMGARVLEWMPQQELVNWYSASDCYVFPKFYTNKSEEDSEKFMSIGVAPVEALGCGLPVIGTNLRGFFTASDVLKGVGGIPEDKDDFVRLVSDVFDNPSAYNRCREMVMRYYSWDSLIEKLISVFDDLARGHSNV